VITGSASYKKEGARIVHSVEEALDLLKEYDSEEIYVIGGESIYRQMLPYCDTAYVTCIDAAFTADTWFPDLDQDGEWKCVQESQAQTHEALTFSFKKYIRI
jgi:dihydrofolate reductase